MRIPFQRKLLATLIPLLCFSAPAWSEETSAVGVVKVEGVAEEVGGGLILKEETPKAKSNVTRSHIESKLATSNAFQVLSLTPGVNTYNNDATGLFGGALTVRGFNSDQLGFTIDGVPVNDSGNFAVYPSEYVDMENMEEIFVTQGSTDSDAPHVGATGGNIGLVSNNPEKERRLRLMQTIGQNSLRKTFVRADTGKLDNGFSGYFSYSNAQSNKWRGPGEAKRDHVDFKGMMDLGGGDSITAGVLWNKMLNNNFRGVTLAQYNANGRYFDYSPTYSIGGTAGTNEIVPGTGTTPGSPYYKLSLNPFENYIANVKGLFHLNDKATLEVQPYFWFGNGTGGQQETTLKETATLGGAIDINGSTTKTDTLLVYRGSVTKTYRPGITTKLNYQWDKHSLLLGYWYEAARHRQTAPATRIDANGNPADIWLQNSLILRADGTPYQNRDQLTVTTAQQFFVQDTFAMNDEKLKFVLGVRNPSVKREYNNYANEGTGQGSNYAFNKTYSTVLPNIGVSYKVADSQMAFVNLAKNSKAPGNFSYQGALVGGVLVTPHLEVETSTNLDVGYRYMGESIVASGSIFSIDFKNRIASAWDPINAIKAETNVGSSTTRGAEAEVGIDLGHGFGTYNSLSYTDSKMNENLPTAATVTRLTAGKQMPDTPKLMSGMALKFGQGGFTSAISAKYTGKIYSTYTNDESVSGYTTVDLDFGYRFVGTATFKKPTIRLNVSNLFDKQYLNMNGGSGSAITINATGTGALSPQYYMSAPRFVSCSVSVDM
jgi:iron complex outermembrane receptor protein